MTTGPSQEFVQRQLELAEEALSDAAYLLQDSRLNAATNRAYYAMFYAALAALASASVQMPKTHKTVANLFFRHFIETGQVPRQFHRDLVKAFQLRQQTDYVAQAQVGKDDVRKAVENARAFVEEIRKLLGLSW